MSVNRELRDEAADAIAAHMRGEIDARALRDRLWSINARLEATRDRDMDLSFALTVRLDGKTPSPTFDEQNWAFARREIAFLRSSLELPDRPPTGPDGVAAFFDANGVSLDARQRKAAVWLLLALAACLATIPLTGLWAVVVWWPFASVVFMRSGMTTLRSSNPLRAWSPFASEQEWLAHRHLVDATGVSDYSQARHAHAGWLRRSSYRMGSLAAVAALYTCVYLMVLLTLPLSLLATLVPRSRRAREA